MSKQPPPASIASAIGPCPTIIQISRTPRPWKFVQHLRTTRPSPNYMKCSVASGSISSQKPAFFSHALLSRSMIHRHTELWKPQSEHINFTFDLRDMSLSLQMGFSFVRAAVACAILERISGLEPSSETTAPRYLKLVSVPNLCPFTFISLWMPFHCLSSIWSFLH